KPAGKYIKPARKYTVLFRKYIKAPTNLIKTNRYDPRGVNPYAAREFTRWLPESACSVPESARSPLESARSAPESAHPPPHYPASQKKTAQKDGLRNQRLRISWLMSLLTSGGLAWPFVA